MDPCWSYALENEGSNLFSEVNAFSVFDKDMIINPNFEEINEGEEIMELWTDHDDNNNNNSNNNNCTSKVILSNDDNNNNFTSEMMLSDDDMNNNKGKRLPTMESRSAECEKGFGGFESSANNKKGKMMMMMMNTTSEFNYCQVPIICRVDGCKMDLSSSKYYHQRHRVCVDHSKTNKAMLHGVEQRFCQQRSRFHLLAEFDDDKRSCRKRLACHNERRRKPRFHIHWGMADASLLSSQNALPIEMLPPFQELSGGENSGRAFSLLSTQTRTRTENHLQSNMDVFHIEAQMKKSSLRKSNNSMNYNKKGFKTSPEIMSGPTIDLHQLSTHLGRVEQQRSSV